MTQIVWDGRFLVADRKCFRNTSVFSARKLRTHYKGLLTTVFAFAGSYEECNLADQIMVTEDNSALIEKAQNILSDPAANWHGICVETYGRDIPKLYLCNYLGMREELPLGTPIAVGACSDEIMYAYRTWQTIAQNINVPAIAMFLPKELRLDNEFKSTRNHAQALVNFIRSTLKGTYYDQEDYLFDVYDSITGEVLCL